MIKDKNIIYEKLFLKNSIFEFDESFRRHFSIKRIQEFLTKYKLLEVVFLFVIN